MTTETEQRPRPAASLMLLRDSQQGPEVLLVKRAARGPFPSLHVFPGGKLNESEEVRSLEPLSQGLDDATASKTLNIPEGGLRYWFACARECFEETGVLLAHTANGKPLGGDGEQYHRLQEYRRRLNAGENGLMGELCRSEKLQLQLGGVVYSAHWITPKIEIKRFDTRFFVAAMPEDQTPVHDGKELVDSVWIRPQDALDASGGGDINLILPTIENLKSLCGFDSCEAVLAARSAAQVNAILPKFVKIDGSWTGLLPSDPRYNDYDD